MWRLRLTSTAASELQEFTEVRTRVMSWHAHHAVMLLLLLDHHLLLHQQLLLLQQLLLQLLLLEPLLLRLHPFLLRIVEEGRGAGAWDEGHAAVELHQVLEAHKPLVTVPPEHQVTWEVSRTVPLEHLVRLEGALDLALGVQI